MATSCLFILKNFPFILCLFRQAEKPLVYQKIFNVSIDNLCINNLLCIYNILVGTRDLWSLWSPPIYLFKPYLFPLNRDRAPPEQDGSGWRAGPPKGPPLPLCHWFNEGCCVEGGRDRWRGPFCGKGNQGNKRDPKF